MAITERMDQAYRALGALQGDGLIESYHRDGAKFVVVAHGGSWALSSRDALAFAEGVRLGTAQCARTGQGASDDS